ncbi:MAG TPA: protein kinase [Polyangiaceae bacterium]|jgi:serine/threonine-protein kinase
MNERKIIGTEDTLAAGLSSDVSLPASSADPPRFPTPTLIAGRYELIGLVGVGGMGSVYRARDAELDEVVALKVLRRELVDAPGMLERFRREVKLARRVTHKNVARTFDIGEHDGERFLTMEFIEGEALGRFLEREGALGVGRAIEIVSAVCAGLAAAHAANVLHRDLKPDNVLLSQDGRIVITDFGVARGGFEANSSQTMGMPVGTPAYMSPEQVEGTETDARTDIYSVGAILYELLVGEPAWAGLSPYTVAAARLATPPPDPRRKRIDVPDALAEVVLRCMSRDRTLRFDGAEELTRALGSIAALIDPLTGRTRVARPNSSAPAREVDKRVAVLPFTVRGESDQEHLAEALTHDLIEALSGTRGLHVPSLGAVLAAEVEGLDPREAGRKLDVQVVLEGNVRRTAGTLRVQARLVSVADGFQLWSRRFERSMGEFFTVADEAATGITEALIVKRASAPRSGPSDPAALDLYLRARREYFRASVASSQRAVALFEDALKRLPNDPRILAGYALAQMRRLGGDQASEAAAHVALRAAERARAAAPNSGEAVVALGTYHFVMGDYQAAAREVNDALRLAPSLPDVHDLSGRLLIEVGRPEEGLAFLERALLLDPRIVRARLDVIRIAALLGDRSAADRLSSFVGADEAEQSGIWFLGARLAMWRGDAAWAERARAKMPAALPLRESLLALCGVVASRRAEPAFLQIADTLGKVTGRVRRRPLFFRQIKAEALAYAGDSSGALSAIEEAASLGLLDLLWLDRCALFAPLRTEPRFRAAREQVHERASRVLDALT